MKFLTSWLYLGGGIVGVAALIYGYGFAPGSMNPSFIGRAIVGGLISLGLIWRGIANLRRGNEK